MNDLSFKQRLSISLSLYPPSICREIYSDSSFMEEHNIEGSMSISVTRINTSFDMGKLFSALRNMQTKAKGIVLDEGNVEWALEIITDGGSSYIEFKSLHNRIIMDEFYILVLEEHDRLSKVKEMCASCLLGETQEAYWMLCLADENITDNLVFEFYEDIKQSPKVILDSIKEKISSARFELPNLVPKIESYYEKIIGSYSDSVDILEFSEKEAFSHIEYLLKHKKWKYLLSTLQHVSMAKAVVSTKDKDYIDQIYKAVDHSNPVQLTAFLELGFWSNSCDSMLNEAVSSFKICGSDRYEAFSSIFVLVYGEISINKLFNTKPVFYKRLAALAHSTMILDMFIEFRIDLANFNDLVRENIGAEFALQALLDLYSDPRWFPEYIHGDEIRADFVGRIVNAYNENADNYSSKFVDDFDKSNENSLVALMTMKSYLPSPVEGNIASQDIPESLNIELQKKLYSENCTIESLVPLFNLVAYFKLEEKDIEELIKMLQENKRRIDNSSTQTSIHYILSGLAKVSCATNNTKLAYELLIVKRIYNNYLDMENSIIDVLAYGLIAAASFKSKQEWAKFIGSWVDELAYLDLRIETQQTLKYWVYVLCRKEPTLFHYCGKSLAALESLDA